MEPIIREPSIKELPEINNFGFKGFELLEPIMIEEFIKRFCVEVLILKLLLE